jgi:hypothetical protein
VIAWWCARGALAAVELESSAAEGVETVIVVTDELGDPGSGETVRVVHRPGLPGSRELAIGITDARGRVRWTPAEGGVARGPARGGVMDVRITRGALPEVTLTLAGLLGALGAGLWLVVLGPLGRRRR